MCPNDATTCPDHGRTATAKAYDKRRGTASSRGYGGRWRRYAQWYRDELSRLNVPRAGLCGSRLPGAPETNDSRCAAKGRITYGRVVDHIQPVSGPDDPRFFDSTNMQLLCDGVTGHGCHDAKRQREVRS